MRAGDAAVALHEGSVPPAPNMVPRDQVRAAAAATHSGPWTRTSHPLTPS